MITMCSCYVNFFMQTYLKGIPGPSIGPPGSRPIVSVVPFGAVVTYKNGTLTVKLGVSSFMILPLIVV